MKRNAGRAGIGETGPERHGGEEILDGCQSGPIRVLYVSKTTDGGAPLSLFHLVANLDRDRYEPLVLFYRKGNPHVLERFADRGVETLVLEEAAGGPGEVAAKQGPGAGASARLARRRLAPSRLIETWIGPKCREAYLCIRSAWKYRRNHRAKVAPILKVIRERQVSLVHLNDGLLLSHAGIRAARQSGLPCVCHVRMFQQLSGFDRRMGRGVSRFIYISSAVRDYYVEQGISPQQGVVVHNAVDLREFDDTRAAGEPEEDAALRAELGCRPGEPLVGVLGRLDCWKGHEYFIEAMARVARDVPSAKGLIVGELEASRRNHEYVERLRRLTASLGLESRILFTGYRRDVPRILRALDVVVLSSAEPEPFGRVVIEGMAAGRAVVATAAGGVLDVVEDRNTGLLVPPKDSTAMAQAILALLEDRDLARRLGDRGRECVRERFTVERHVASVQAIYESVLHPSESPKASERRAL